MPVRRPCICVAHFVSILLVAAFWSTACTATTPTLAITPTVANSQGSAYPGASESGYPSFSSTFAPPTGGYPAPDATRDPSIVPFVLDRPLVAGSTEVTGAGPAGVPIVLHDVTFMGEELGTTVVGLNNRFSIVVQPLEAAHRVGVAIGDLTGTEWTSENFEGSRFDGPQPMMVPQAGIYLDSVLVTEP